LDLFFPINKNNNHWLLAEINFTNKTITLQNSMLQTDNTILQNLHKYLHHDYLKQTTQALPEEWRLLPCPETTPRQTNNDDCGAYTCFFANHIMRAQPLPPATPADATVFQQHIVVSILNNTAIYGYLQLQQQPSK
jgi:sentrin-specific protease 1